MPTILLATPHYDGRIHGGAAMGAFIPGMATERHDLQVIPRNVGGSLLANVFNRLWAEALIRRSNQEVDYFVMLHADIAPCQYWLDTLVAELERLDADVVSAVVPIKQSGVPWERIETSTAIGGSDSWKPVRKLTLGDCEQLPPTFSIADTAWPNEKLLVNTGCWIANLHRPFWTYTDGAGDLKHYFTIRDRIKIVGRDSAGRLGMEVMVEPEDWGFSRRLPDEAKVYATTAVHVEHIGVAKWRNWREGPDAVVGGNVLGVKTEMEATGVC